MMLSMLNCFQMYCDWVSLMIPARFAARPTMMARIGILRAFNRRVERVFDPPRNEKHWGRRKLKRDE